MQHKVRSQYPLGYMYREISSPKKAKLFEKFILVEMEADYLDLMLVRVRPLGLSRKQ